MSNLDSLRQKWQQLTIYSNWLSGIPPYLAFLSCADSAFTAEGVAARKSLET